MFGDSRSVLLIIGLNRPRRFSALLWATHLNICCQWIPLKMSPCWCWWLSCCREAYRLASIFSLGTGESAGTIILNAARLFTIWWIRVLQCRSWKKPRWSWMLSPIVQTPCEHPLATCAIHTLLFSYKLNPQDKAQAGSMTFRRTLGLEHTLLGTNPHSSWSRSHWKGNWGLFRPLFYKLQALQF